MLASLLNVLLWYSMCSLKTLSDIIYLPHKFQIKCVETIFLLNAALCFLQTRLQIHSKRGCKVTLAALHWFDMSSNTFSFMVTKTSMWFFKIEPLSTYFTRFLLRLGFVPLVVPSESGCLPSLRKAQKRCPTLFRDRVSERYTSKKICKTMHDLVKM